MAERDISNGGALPGGALPGGALQGGAPLPVPFPGGALGGSPFASAGPRGGVTAPGKDMARNCCNATKRFVS